MEYRRELTADRGFTARAVPYRYRYCPRCRREWPAELRSCPQCVHWLGEQPLERIEWQLAPTAEAAGPTNRYESIGGVALVVRIVCAARPNNEQLAQLDGILCDIVTIPDASVCDVSGHGWLIWTVRGLRQAFRNGCEIERRLVASLATIERIFLHCGRVRWGVWTDQYLLPFHERDAPVVEKTAADAIFDFEPDDLLQSSESVYQINRRWEHFVAAPLRLLDGRKSWGFRSTGRKRPSALDHAQARESSPFVGRERHLSFIENHWKRVGRAFRLSITAAAGSGKTRLMREWLKRHPDLGALVANFSLFGGTVEDVAGQLAELPPDHLGFDSLIQSVLARIKVEAVKVLVIDDLHWADRHGLDFVRRLLARLPTGLLVLLMSRPSGRIQLRSLSPDAELALNPLPAPDTERLARRLAASEAVASIAARRSKGNPLFVEQFVAWAIETGFCGGSAGPHTLHQVIAARIERLSKVRVAEIRERLRWGGSWERQAIQSELESLEIEVGLWLDRLETGDYADRVEASRHLRRLERLDYEIFLTSMLLGRPRPRSSRLREAIERLLIGSADEVMADLKRRAAGANSITREELSKTAERAGDVLFSAYRWTQARDFYELASAGACWRRSEIMRRLEVCIRHGRDAILDDEEIYGTPEHEITSNPKIDAIDLPYVWAKLGRLQRRGLYFLRAAEAAEAINDTALATWAKRKAAEFSASARMPSIIDEGSLQH